MGLWPRLAKSGQATVGGLGDPGDRYACRLGSSAADRRWVESPAARAPEVTEWECSFRRMSYNPNTTFTIHFRESGLGLPAPLGPIPLLEHYLMERYPISTDTWKAWQSVYDSLSTDDTTDAGKKKKLLYKAMKTLRDITRDPDVLPTMGAYFLGRAEQDRFRQTGRNVPDFFTAAFDTHSSTPLLDNQPDGYSYERAGDDQADDFRVWVDFAAKSIGGGVFDDGFVEEEQMVLESPDLAAFAANGYNPEESKDTRPRTRTGTTSGVLEGDPTPLLFKGARHVTEISEKYYGGDALRNTDCTTLLDATKPLTAAQTVVILAMAAPYLGNPPNPQPNDLSTIKDLYTTFVAGFELAREAFEAQTTDKRLVLNTGAIGCGAFHNSKEVVFVLQILAARQVGKIHTLRFWKCSDSSEIKQYQGLADHIVEEYTHKKTKTVEELLNVARACLS
jgi:hypothetical protein